MSPCRAREIDPLKAADGAHRAFSAYACEAQQNARSGVGLREKISAIDSINGLRVLSDLIRRVTQIAETPEIAC